MIFKKPYKGFCYRNDENNSKGCSKMVNSKYVIILGMGNDEHFRVKVITQQKYKVFLTITKSLVLVTNNCSRRKTIDN